MTVAAALANLAGVLVAGSLLGAQIWVVAIGLLAWVVAGRGPLTPRVLIIAALLLGFSVVAYVAVVVLIGVLLESLV